MAFARFLEELGQRKNELLYLTTQVRTQTNIPSKRPAIPTRPITTTNTTTQELELGPDDRPDIMSSPVTELQGDFPLRPALLGHLVPQNVNLWMGRRWVHCELYGSRCQSIVCRT